MFKTETAERNASLRALQRVNEKREARFYDYKDIHPEEPAFEYTLAMSLPFLQLIFFLFQLSTSSMEFSSFMILLTLGVAADFVGMRLSRTEQMLFYLPTFVNLGSLIIKILLFVGTGLITCY